MVSCLEEFGLVVVEVVRRDNDPLAALREGFVAEDVEESSMKRARRVLPAERVHEPANSRLRKDRLASVSVHLDD